MSSQSDWSLRTPSCIALLYMTLLVGPPSLFAQAAPPWLQEQEKKWLAAFNAGDAAALAAMYAVDAVILLPNQTTRGRPAIDNFQKAYFTNMEYSCTWPMDGTHTLDKLVAVWGHSTCTGTPKSGGPAQTAEGTWLRVYELQADGSWLIVRDTGQRSR